MAAGPVKAHSECASGAPGHTSGTPGVQSLPGDEEQRLALTRGQCGERVGKSILQCPRRRAGRRGLSSQAIDECESPTFGALLVGQYAPSDPKQPWQRIGVDVIQTPPRDQKRLGDSIIDARPRRTSQHIALHITVMELEQSLKAAAAIILGTHIPPRLSGSRPSVTRRAELPITPPSPGDGQTQAYAVNRTLAFMRQIAAGRRSLRDERTRPGSGGGLIVRGFRYGRSIRAQLRLRTPWLATAAGARPECVLAGDDVDALVAQAIHKFATKRIDLAMQLTPPRRHSELLLSEQVEPIPDLLFAQRPEVLRRAHAGILPSADACSCRAPASPPGARCATN